MVLESDVNVVIADLPPRIRSFTICVNGFYTVVVDDKLCPEARLNAYKHEIYHIEKGDFDRSRNGNVDLIEIFAHKEVE